MEQDCESEQLFMLEILVENVEIDTSKVPETLSHNIPHPPPLRVAVSFVYFDPLEVCQKELQEPENMVCSPSKVVANFNSGKSLLFPMSLEELKKSVINEPLYVVVFRKFGDDIHTVGVTDVRVRKIWDEIVRELSCPCGDYQISRKMKGSYTLHAEEGEEQVGKVSMFIRISCIGKSTFTQFQVFENKKCFLFRHSVPVKAGDADNAGISCSNKAYITEGADDAMPEGVNIVPMALAERAEVLEKAETMEEDPCSCSFGGIGAMPPSSLTESKFSPGSNLRSWDKPAGFQRYKMDDLLPKDTSFGKDTSKCMAPQPCPCVTSKDAGKENFLFTPLPDTPKLPHKCNATQPCPCVTGALPDLGTKDFSFKKRDSFETKVDAFASGEMENIKLPQKCKAPQPCPCVTGVRDERDQSQSYPRKTRDGGLPSRLTDSYGGKPPYEPRFMDMAKKEINRMKAACYCSDDDAVGSKERTYKEDRVYRSEEGSKSDGEMPPRGNTLGSPPRTPTISKVKAQTQSNPVLASSRPQSPTRKRRGKKGKTVEPENFNLQKIETHTECVKNPNRVPHDMGWQWKQKYIRKAYGRGWKPGNIRASVLKQMKRAVGDSLEASAKKKKKKAPGKKKDEEGVPTIRLRYHAGVYYVSMSNEAKKPDVKVGEEKDDVNDPVKLRFFKTGDDEDSMSEMSDFEVEFTPPPLHEDETPPVEEKETVTVSRATQWLDTDLPPPATPKSKADSKGGKKGKKKKK